MISNSEFIILYPHTKIDSSDITDQYLPFAENWVQAKLAPMFSLPFSDNNKTYDQIVYMKAWHQILLRSRDPDDSGEVGDRLDKWVDELLEGTSAMVTNSGTPIFGEDQFSTVKEEITSNTKDYTRVFDMDNALNSVVDPDRIEDIDNERG